MRWLLSLLNVTRKELTQTLRDKRMLFTILLAPVLQLTLLGYAVDLDVDRIPTVVCDQDRTPESRGLVDAFFADRTFTRVSDVIEPRAATVALQRGDAAVAVVVERGFALRRARHADPEVQILIDGTDSTRAQVATNDAAQFLLLHGIGGERVRLSRRGPTLTPRILYNQRLATPLFMVPGIAASLLLNVTAIMTAMGLAREKEAGTLEQVLVTPIRPAVLLAGKCLPFILFGLIDVCGVLLVGSLLFDLPLRGPLTTIGIAASLYLFSTLGIGILLATVSSSQQQAILGAFSFIMPAMMLSGFMTPIESMPAWFQPLTLLNPMRHFIEIARGCLLKGAGLADFGRQLAALALIGASVLAISVARFRTRLS